jgi:hypothetical protein
MMVSGLNIEQVLLAVAQGLKEEDADQFIQEIVGRAETNGVKKYVMKQQ